jgi:hypothetical protein
LHCTHRVHHRSNQTKYINNNNINNNNNNNNNDNNNNNNNNNNNKHFLQHSECFIDGVKCELKNIADDLISQLQI